MDLRLEVVVVPVADVDRAEAFYTERLGFRLDADYPVDDDYRVVQVTPPGSECSIIFGTGVTSAADRAALPQVVSTDPETAAVGLTTEDAARAGQDVDVVDYDIGHSASQSARAQRGHGRLDQPVNSHTVGPLPCSTAVSAPSHSATGPAKSAATVPATCLPVCGWAGSGLSCVDGCRAVIALPAAGRRRTCAAKTRRPRAAARRGSCL